MTEQQRKAVVIGAGGFVGQELLRLLALHPHFELAAAYSSTYAGASVAEVQPQLEGFCEVTYTTFTGWNEQIFGEPGVTVFLAMAHGRSMKTTPQLVRQADASDLQIVDLSGDFRLTDPSGYERFYGGVHPAPELLERFVYGLPELCRDQITGARFVANPGCFATAASLAVLGAARAGWPLAAIAIDGMTGSSGAGVAFRPTTHHPLRMNNCQPYKPLQHQHLPEIEQVYAAAAHKAAPVISFVPIMAPMVRGIVVSAHHVLMSGTTQEQAAESYQQTFAAAPFVKIVASPPGVTQVWGSNRCHLCVTAEQKIVVVTVAIDNLIKGAAGQAIQNANLMNGWEETTGLLTPMPRPV